jgi:ureidoglycolate lyase
VQLIEPVDDMRSFGSEDAQLNLSNGTPRLYIMRLPAKAQGLSFTQITHHKKVTQCLGSLTPEDWCVHLPGGIGRLQEDAFCLLNNAAC